MNKICVFTDGSVINNNSNNRYAGVGIFYDDNNENNSSIILNGNYITNQIAELSAILIAIQKTISNNPNADIYIFTDSLYSIKCITQSAIEWEKNNWDDNIKNIKLIKKIYALTKTHNITFKHVNSNKKKPNNDINSDEYYRWYGNHMADKLAKIASKKAANKNIVNTVNL